MKNKLVNWVAVYVGKKLDGKKTYAGAAGKMITGLVAVLTGVVGLLGLAFPDQGLPAMDWDTASVAIAGGVYGISDGLADFGIGHKIVKAQASGANVPE